MPRPLVWMALIWIMIVLTGCGKNAQEDSARALGGAPTSEDPGPIHVHGLGVNPADGALFIASHTGLFRVPEDAEEAERVAGRYQDTMGFTIIGPDRFLGSGHPDGREDLPPFLGLIRSVDAGETWDPVSLLGKADFHLLESGGDVVYGYGSDFKTREQQLLVSADGGKSWKQRPLPERASDQLTQESLRSIVLDPENPSVVVASGQEALWTSTDQGRHWSFLSADTGLLAWSESDEIHLVTDEGEVKTSGDGGRTWAPAGSIGGAPAAFEATGDGLHVALHDGAIKRSDDGGATWSVRSTP
ncbi:MAG: F510_1955 family glycosylhydrolase [Solirubrobacterales bacterium]